MRNKKKIRTSAEASYQKLIRKYNLTILELDLLDKLADTQRRPEEKYQLLVKKSTLRHAVNKIEDFSEAENNLLTQLNIKLGFNSPPEEDLTDSTRSLPQGLPVKLKLSETDYVDAEIYSVSESNITVKYPNQNPPVEPGRKLMLFSSDSGRFRVFTIQPDKIKEELFTAAHVESKTFEKINPRIDVIGEYKHISEQDGSEKIIELKSIIVFLSPGGTFLYDKQNKLHTGDNIRIFFSNDIKKQYPVPADIIKTSEEKKLASAKFMN